MLRFILILTAASSLSSATAFYVSPKGHDSYPGTALKPWTTLQHAVDSIQHGDTILVEAGTYAGCRIEIPGLRTRPRF